MGKNGGEMNDSKSTEECRIKEASPGNEAHKKSGNHFHDVIYGNNGATILSPLTEIWHL